MEKAFNKDDYFKIDPEAHLVGDSSPYEYFPGTKQWWYSLYAIKRPMNQGMPQSYMNDLEPHEMKKDPDPASLLAAMDKYGVDIACLLPESMMDTTGYTGRFCSNGEMAKVVEATPTASCISRIFRPSNTRASRTPYGSSNTGSRRRAPRFSNTILRKTPT